MSDEKPIALEAYEKIAERYSALAESKAENGYIEHPAMRKQIAEVSGLNILDAGCGPGILSTFLMDQGATVTAFDLSPKMIELAKRRAGNRGTFFVGDLAEPLANLKNAHFDLVVSSLAIDYVRDWAIPLREFHRLLKPKGRLVFSVQHPLAAFLWYKPLSAFGVHSVEMKWQGFGGEPIVMPDYYRSFEEMANPLIRAGFTIKSIVETKPIEALREKDPRHFEKYHREPSFMIFDTTRD